MKGCYNRKQGVGIIFEDVFLVNGARTAFGKYCGSLARISPTDLGIIAVKAALQRAATTPDLVDQLIAANIGQSSADAYFLPRHISLFAGLPLAVPALMVQRICGSGFETLITGAEQITLGKAGIVACVGTENMSLSPTVSFGNRMGYPLGKPVFIDMLWEALDDTAAGYPMGFTAENIARKYKISREEADAFAVLSFERAVLASQKKFFEGEIESVHASSFEREGLKPRTFSLPRGVKEFKTDEHVRPTTADQLSQLPPVFEKVGILTAGNCSGIVDGAASVVLSHKRELGTRKPLAIVRGAASCGVEPKEMGLGPVPAIRMLTEIAGLKPGDIGLFEINEAFSAQIIGCERELNLDRSTLNVNGGAIAIGHPLAATGVRLSLTLARAMKERKVKYGIASACIGGGQGTAILLENPDL